MDTVIKELTKMADYCKNSHCGVCDYSNICHTDLVFYTPKMMLDWITENKQMLEVYENLKYNKAIEDNRLKKLKYLRRQCYCVSCCENCNQVIKQKCNEICGKDCTPMEIIEREELE